MDKPAATDHPIHDLIRTRWSPRSFRDQPVAEDDRQSLLEAARWAASCRNEQPWRFVVAASDDDPEAHARLLACLTESNQRWAAHAPVLMLVVACRHFAHNGKPNRHAFYDCGQAMAMLSVEATARGLALHQMAGFDREQATRDLGIPADEFEPVAMVALGYPGKPDALPDELADRERAARSRRPQAEFVHHGMWNRTKDDG